MYISDKPISANNLQLSANLAVKKENNTSWDWIMHLASKSTDNACSFMKRVMNREKNSLPGQNWGLEDVYLFNLTST